MKLIAISDECTTQIQATQGISGRQGMNVWIMNDDVLDLLTVVSLYECLNYEWWCSWHVLDYLCMVSLYIPPHAKMLSKNI